MHLGVDPYPFVDSESLSRIFLPSSVLSKSFVFIRCSLFSADV